MPLPKGVISNRYWNANGYGVTAIACWVHRDPQWAAYIGAQPDPASELETVDWVRRFGSKLDENAASALFPSLAETMKERGVSYRG